MLNVEAENGVSLGEFCEAVFGAGPRNQEQQWEAENELHIGVLRPLCWAGLLDENHSKGGELATQTYEKTKLWPDILNLRTDEVVWKSMPH
jgi:hypothetical protein